LQSHLRTSVTVENAIDYTSSSSQVETDDLDVGLDEHGARYMLPAQAKGGTECRPKAGSTKGGNLTGKLGKAVFVA